MTSPVIGSFQLAGEANRAYGAHTNPSAAIPDAVGGVAYSEQTPILVVINPAGSGRTACFDTVSLRQTNTPGAVSHFRIVLDIEARYEKMTGVQVDGHNFKAGATATAQDSILEIWAEEPDLIESAQVTGSSPQYVDFMTLPTTAGTEADFSMQGRLVLPAGYLFAVYAWTATGDAVTSRFRLRWVEKNAS